MPQRYITHYSVEELVAWDGDPEKLRAMAYGMIHGYHTLLRSLAYLAIDYLRRG